MDKSTALKIVAEKLARRIGVRDPEFDIDFLEDGDFRIYVYEKGELKGLLWVNVETGKIWGFSFSQGAPEACFRDQVEELVEIMRRVM